MAFDGLQHVGKPPEDMRPDRFALVTTGLYGGIGIDAEMIGPEPHQPFAEADLSTDRRLEPSLGLIEKDAPRQRYLIGRLCRRRRLLRLRRHRIFHAGVFGDIRRRFALPASDLVLCVTLGIEFENSAVRSPAAW